jgi:hypothetical protein
VEQVYILGRMGSTREALTLIMTKLGDIEQAIDFVQGQQDDDLWEELIKHRYVPETFREHSETFREHSGNIQKHSKIFREHSGLGVRKIWSDILS